MDRFLAGFAMLLFGCGVVALLVGLLWDRYSWQTGVIAMAVFWAFALSLTAFLSRGRNY